MLTLNFTLFSRMLLSLQNKSLIEDKVISLQLNHYALNLFVKAIY